jgi:hypothetical protein
MKKISNIRPSFALLTVIVSCPFVSLLSARGPAGMPEQEGTIKSAAGDTGTLSQNDETGFTRHAGKRRRGFPRMEDGGAGPAGVDLQ